MPLRTCETCGRPFAPRHPRVRHCAAHEPRGRAQRSPTTRAQDAEYQAERRRVLSGHPLCYWGCGRPAATADHLRPVAAGGGHRGNLVPACRRCNSARQANPDWRPPARPET